MWMARLLPMTTLATGGEARPDQSGVPASRASAVCVVQAVASKFCGDSGGLWLFTFPKNLQPEYPEYADYLNLGKNNGFK